MADAQTTANPIPGFDINALNGLLGNMNIPNLQSMLGGVNFNQIMPLIPSMLKMMGNSFGNTQNPGYNNINSYNSGYNMNGYNSGFNNSRPLNSNSYNENPSYYRGGPGYPINPIAEPFVIPPHLQGDPKFLILNTVRPMIPQDKVHIVDQIARLLVLYITITSLIPKRPPAAEVVPPPPAAPQAAPAATPALLPPQA